MILPSAGQFAVSVLMLGTTLPALWWLFRGTWRTLDADALKWRARLSEKGETDWRPAVALLLGAFVLTQQHFFGSLDYYDQSVNDRLAGLASFKTYGGLYRHAWWAFIQVTGYVLPLGIWKLCFPKDSLLDMGFRTRGLGKHLWIYGIFLAVVLPTLLLTSRMAEFGAAYPFYRESERSWFDFLCWEALYVAQFIGLEIFFRGFLLGALRRSLGSSAIFAMAAAYCLLHFGKPYLEANAAIVTGVALGSLALMTRSVYLGIIAHVTVAMLMDWLSLWHRHALPTSFWP